MTRREIWSRGSQNLKRGGTRTRTRTRNTHTELWPYKFVSFLFPRFFLNEVRLEVFKMH